MSRRRGTQTKLMKNPKEAERGYGIGERNPTTLPGSHVISESWRDNAVRSQGWRKIRKWVASVNSTGAKY